jgi:hypothetical protein
MPGSLGQLWGHTLLGTTAYPGAHFVHESGLLVQAMQFTSLMGGSLLGLSPQRPKQPLVALAARG